MPSLADTQRDFVAALLQAQTGTPHAIESAVLSAGVHAAQRLEVYRNNVFSNYRGALQAVYPVIERLVGEHFFRHACDLYVARHASTSGDLHNFGGELSLFLESYPPAASLPYLADVARLEWLYHRIFHAAEHAPLPLTRLAAVEPERYAQLRFTLHPAAALMHSAFPVLRIWQVNQAQYAGEQRVDLGEGADHLLITREHFEIKIARVAPEEYAFLCALRDGAPLAQAVDAALAQDAAFDLQGVLAKHVSAATLVNFAA